MEIILESVAWVALGFGMTLLALKVSSKSKELRAKIGVEGYTKMGMTV